MSDGDGEGGGASSLLETGASNRKSDSPDPPTAVERRPHWESPLLGVHPRRTLFAVSLLGAIILLVAFTHFATRVPVGGVPLETTTGLFDSLTAFVIALATATVLLGPYGYALWNGGPGLAAAIPLVPVAAGELLTGRHALGLDGAIAITTATGGATLGWYALEARRAGSVRPWRHRVGAGDVLFGLTVACLVSGGVVWQFLADSPPFLVETYRPLASLWLVPAAVLGRYWLRICADRFSRSRAGYPDSERGETH